MEKEHPPAYSPPEAGFHPPPPQGQYGHQSPAQGQYGYPPPPQGQYGNPPPPTHTVIVTQGTPMMLGPQPTHTTCPSCHAQILTSVQSEATSKTHLFALLLCLFGCWPCCCIPYCVDSCQGQNHHCPNCKAFLGTYNN